MDALLHVLKKFQYPQRNWTYTKVITITVWLAFVLLELKGRHNTLRTTGIFQYINLIALVSSPYKYIIGIIAIILSLLYIYEKYMPFVILLLAAIGIMVFSIAVAEGNRPRFEILSMVLIAQFIAYVQYQAMNTKFKAATTPWNLAMLYSIQVIASCYMLSAISKFHYSGIQWIINAPYSSLRVIVSFTSRSLDFNWPWLVPMGQKMASIILGHPWLIRIAFAITFLIEFFALVSVAGRKQARRYGYLILLMHLFIFLIMGIVIIPFFFLAIAYLINLPDKNYPVEYNQSTNEKTPGITAALVYLALPVIFITLSLQIGEHHPFSRYPMFKSMDASADLYWLEDEHGAALSPLKCFGLRTDELKNLLGDAALAHGMQLKSSTALPVVSQPLLQSLVNAHLINIKAQNISDIKLMHHLLWIENDKIYQRDTILANVSPEDTKDRN